MYCTSALGRKKKKTDGSTGDHSIDLKANFNPTSSNCASLNNKNINCSQVSPVTWSPFLSLPLWLFMFSLTHHHIHSKKFFLSVSTVKVIKFSFMFHWLESRFVPATFRGCFFNLILYDFVQSFFHIFVTAVKCSLPFLELCFILTFSNFHVLFGHEKKITLEIFTDTRLQLSRFTFKNKTITGLG